MKRTATIALAIVVLAVVCVGSFLGGMMYGKNQPDAARVTVATTVNGSGQGAMPPGGQGGPGTGQGGQGRGGMLSGQVESIADGVMTIADSKGKQTQVKVTDTTLIQKQASVPLSNLQTGESVLVSGSQNSDGSITARSVQVVNGAALEAPTDNQNADSQGAGNMPPGFPGGGNVPPGFPGGARP
jgi:hypothetical protein